MLMYRLESPFAGCELLKYSSDKGQEKSAGPCNSERKRIYHRPMEQPSANGLRFPIFFSNIHLTCFYLGLCLSDGTPMFF